MAYLPQKRCTPLRRPSALESHPMGWAGRREAMRTPTVEQLATIIVLRNANSKTGAPGCDRFSARNTRPSAVRTRERAHTDHASRAEASGLTLPPPHPCCSLAPCVTTLLYSTTILLTLRQALRGSFSEQRRTEPSKIYLARRQAMYACVHEIGLGSIGGVCALCDQTCISSDLPDPAIRGSLRNVFMVRRPSRRNTAACHDRL